MNISQHYFTFPAYLPSIIRFFHNWPLYLCNYLCRRKKPAEYRMRNGFHLIDSTGTLTGTIAVVFIRREYGSLSNLQTIVDIGANMGAFAVYAAWLSPKARIYCYEPEEQNVHYLEKNITVNSLQSRVSIYNSAVASSNGNRNIILTKSPIHSFFGGEVNDHCQTVACTTLGEIIATHGLNVIDLLKINCEGAEYEILENCTSNDYERILNIRLEYHNLGAQKNGKHLLKLLKNNGYNIHRFSSYREESGFIWASRISKGE